VLDPDSDLHRRVRKWVEETTRAQGLSVHATDAAPLRRVAEMLGPTSRRKPCAISGAHDLYDHSHLGVVI
jgi:hypothetical protein